LGIVSHVFKVVLPASVPLIFTGLRISLSVAWMVLIAIELLAQSPGLGSFVWEEFQNGANDSNAKIIVAMFVIGGIGYALDRIMMSIQKMVSYESK
jgi:nitrate/nitrite transport system permease protein